jgi:phenylpropionate dioxygenase-like ring-hydroxylating dioxygenase large terminal subunit
MTTQTEGELLTRVGPGTPMGELLREYWLPAALSSELVADGDPVRLVLLGERLLAFRDSAGRVGIMDHRCPHRCASLFYGRNEEGGIRCIYHGWKFDVDGNCLDQPNLPEHQVFKHKVHAKAYRVAESNGLIWCYMGARKTPPPPPAFESTFLPKAELRITFAMRECNWLQALEGDIDTSHFSFLHLGALKPEELPEDQVGRWVVESRTPEFAVETTKYGLIYGAHRPADPGETYWRIAQYLFPFWTMPPTGPFSNNIHTRAWIPMDDTHVMFVSMMWTNGYQSLGPRKDGTPVPGHVGGIEHLLPNTSDWYGRWRLKGNARNDYLIDRDKQRRMETYSGIHGIHLQDQAITESMGEITDFSFEHMAPSDVMVLRTRKRMLDAVRAHQKNRDASVLPGHGDPQLFKGLRGGEFVAPDNYDLMGAYRHAVQKSADPTGTLMAAE